MKTIIAATLAATVLTGTASAAEGEVQMYFGGNYLHEFCSSDAPTGIMFCRGFVAGAVDVLSANGVVCLPAKASLGQTTAIVIKRLADRPEDRHHSAQDIVRLAVTEAFPCKGGKQ